MNIHVIGSLDLRSMTKQITYVACDNAFDAKRAVAKRLGNAHLVCWRGLAYEELKPAENWEMLDGEHFNHVTLVV